MTEFIILSRVDMLTLRNDKPVTVYVDKKPYVLCTDEYFEKQRNEMDCRDCKEYEDCPCGKDGHENGTSQGYSIGECKDFVPQESEDNK